MNKFIVLKKLLTNKNYRFIAFSKYGFYNSMNNEEYLKRLFKASMGYDLDLNCPSTFNEKIQWLKLYYHNSQLPILADKYAVKSYISEILGPEYVIPTIGIWNNVKEIDYNKLPDKFVIKCTHDSGGLVICKDKNKLNLVEANNILNRSLKRDYYNIGREWAYKDIPKRIMAEELLIDDMHDRLIEYKIFCFDGKAKMIDVCCGEPHTKTCTHDYLDINLERLPFHTDNPISEKIIQKPSNFDNMIYVAETLSHGFPHVRVDLYNIQGKIYFGEMTFYHCCGLCHFEPPEWDAKLGELINLPNQKII